MDKLDKEQIKWLRTYGYTLNAEHEGYKIIKDHIKTNYPYEYYMYIDLEIKQEAEKLLEAYRDDYKMFIKSFKKNFNRIRKELIKEKYKLSK